MSEPNTKDLLDRMLASGKLSADAAADLRDFREELAQGRLDAADAAYVQALARRLGFIAGGSPIARADAGTADDDEEEDEVTVAPDRAAGILEAVRSAVDDLCHPDRLAPDDPEREAKARLHAALSARLDGIARDLA